MFFHHLSHFSPYSGHLYNALKVPFVRKDDEVFERSDKRFDLMDREGYFPFKELIRNGQVYFISDDSLLDFLRINEGTIDLYEVDHWAGWNMAFKEQLVEHFANGYENGKGAFEQNLGVTYTTLQPKERQPYLRAFCFYCLDFLYFEGDLDKSLFYNLGYLQSSLYRGFVELNHLLALSPDAGAAIRLHFESYVKSSGISKKDKDEATPSTRLQPKKDEIRKPTERIELLCDITEIKTIWSVLIGPIQTKNGLEEAVFSEKELEQFLGAAFSSGAFPTSLKISEYKTVKLTSRGDMRSVLDALMYATFGINHNFNRSAKMPQYAAILKTYFAVYSGSDIPTIKSVIAGQSAKGIKVLKNSSASNPHIEEMLNILKKHKLLH